MLCSFTINLWHFQFFLALLLLLTTVCLLLQFFLVAAHNNTNTSSSVSPDSMVLYRCFIIISIIIITHVVTQIEWCLFVFVLQVRLQRYHWLYVLQPRCDEAAGTVGSVWHKVVSRKPHRRLSKPTDSVRPPATVCRVWNVRHCRLVRQWFSVCSIVALNASPTAKLYRLETDRKFLFRAKNNIYGIFSFIVKNTKNSLLLLPGTFCLFNWPVISAQCWVLLKRDVSQ